MVRTAHRETGLDSLCLAGGVALNAVANGRVAREGPFKHIWVQPAAGDAGGSLGAALLAWHRYYESPRTINTIDSMCGALLGPEYDDSQIAGALDEMGARYERLAPDEVAAKTAQLIADQNVVGWFQGRMEFGPRALGARSIVADARNPEMQSLINLKIKFREGFRPFAPSILENRAADYFELGDESPYMLIVAPVKGSHRIPLPEGTGKWGIDLLNTPRSDIPAVTHLDYSARIQTVNRERTPLWHDLLAELERITGSPLVVNTSFNVRGEPIVCTPADAYRCFMRTHLDYLVIGSFLVDKREQPEFDDAAWQALIPLD